MDYSLKRGWKDRFRCWLAKRILPKEVGGWIDTGFVHLIMKEKEDELKEYIREYPPEIHDLE